MILFVFEGARREPMLFESIKYLFFEKETDTIVYSFGNNIYNLYKQIMELGTGDIVSLLREIHQGNEENPFKDIAYTGSIRSLDSLCKVFRLKFHRRIIPAYPSI